jgi:hypothetical protein
MPAQSSPRFPRGFGGGFGPLLSGGYSDQNMRVSDAERQAVADRLAEHYSEGRLDQAEFDDRAGRAMSAKTRADLRGLFDDLPEPGLAGVPADATSSGSPARRRRRHSGRGILAVALIIFIVVAAGHTVFWLTVPWLWLAFLAVIVLAATGRIGRSRSHGSRVD